MSDDFNEEQSSDTALKLEDSETIEDFRKGGKWPGGRLVLIGRPGTASSLFTIKFLGVMAPIVLVNVLIKF